MLLKYLQQSDDQTIFAISEVWYTSSMAEKAEFDCAPYVPQEKTDLEIDALEIYPDLPEAVAI